MIRKKYFFPIFSLNENKIQNLVRTFVPLELGSFIIEGQKWLKTPKLLANVIFIKVMIWDILT